MKQEEMLKQLSCLKEYCESAGEVYSEEVWKSDVKALNMAISLLGEGYLDDIAYIRDLFNYIFIFLGVLVLLAVIIVCRL